MITCMQRVRIYGKEVKLCLVKLLAVKLSSLNLAYSIGLCRFFVHVSGGVKKVSSSTTAWPSLRKECSSPMGIAIICPSLIGTSV
jgi:hypothetical protein